MLWTHETPPTESGRSHARLSDSESPQTLEEERLSGRRIRREESLQACEKRRSRQTRSQSPSCLHEVVFGFCNKQAVPTQAPSKNTLRATCAPVMRRFFLRGYPKRLIDSPFRRY